MYSAKKEEDQAEITSLRKEVLEWKQKYYDCRRKLPAGQVLTNLPSLAKDN